MRYLHQLGALIALDAVALFPYPTEGGRDLCWS
jgi:hypothetical protein